MKNKIINKLFGKELIQAMKELLEKFKKLNYDINDIEKDLKGINESVRVGIYLMALEKNYDNLAIKIKRANNALNDLRMNDFLKAYKDGKTDRFLATLGKGDKLSLMSDLGVDVDVRERVNLTKEEQDYYRIISNSIMEDQAIDQRDGIDQFITYKKEAE